jgi:RNA recognition motif-containing protein
MEIYIGNLPRYSTAEEMAGFVSSATNGRWISALRGAIGKVDACEIVRTISRDDKVVNTYAIVTIANRKKAIKAIRLLRKNRYLGRRLVVHRFHHRLPVHEKRVEDFAVRARSSGERRTRDRRRPRYQLPAGRNPVMDLGDHWERVTARWTWE